MALARVRMSVRMRFWRGRAAPGPAGEVADLAFQDGPVLPVGLLARRDLAGFGLLEGGFMGMDNDHPAAAGFGAFRPQRTRAA